MSAVPPRRRSRTGSARGSLGRRLRRVPLPLAAILLAAALNAFAWSYATPPLQGPDESAHMGYVQHLAETGSPPKRNTGNWRAFSTEQGVSMVIGGLNTLPTVRAARPSWAPADERELRRTEPTLPAEARKDGEGPNAVAQNPPLYYAFAAVPYWAGRALGIDFVGRVMLIRWATSLFYLATIALTWALVAELMRATWPRVVAAGVVALIPQLAFIGAIVNPDILLVAIWTGFIALSARTVRRGPTASRIVGLGALAAASLMTHGRGLVLLPVAIVVAAFALWTHRERIRWRGALAWSAGALGLVAAGGVAALLVTRSATGGAAYGGGVATVESGTPFNIRQFLSYVWQFYFQRLPSMSPTVGPEGYGFRQVWVETFFARFGSLDTQFRTGIYDLLQLLVVGGLLAFYTAAVVRWRWIVAHWQMVLTLAVTPAAMLTALHLAAYRQLTNASMDPLLQGRYLLPCVGLVGLAAAALCASLPRRAGAALAGSLLAIGVLLSLGGLGISVVRFYV